jgi:hypothetical protein
MEEIDLISFLTRIGTSIIPFSSFARYLFEEIAKHTLGNYEASNKVSHLVL